MSLEPVLLEEGELSDREIRERLAGNLCRCTGYQNIVTAVKLARERTGAPETADNPN
jgi:carbon-monoxide dehydrogenase small subunit